MHAVHPWLVDVLKVSVAISTRNRAEELERTLAALSRLEPAPHELLICADGCSDGTIALLKRWPERVKVIEHAEARGSIASRNELIRMAAGDLILCLDDDSYPEQSDAIVRIQKLFEFDKQMAVAVFPQRSEEFPESLERRKWDEASFCGSYASSGAVLRKKVFLSLGGYPEFFFHAYEEPDFSLRCIAEGYTVVFTPEVTVRHHYTQRNRNEIRIHHFHARNEQWSIWMRCPFLLAVPVAIFRAMRQLRYASSRGIAWLLREPVWWLACLRGLPRALKNRQTVSIRGYLKWMRILRRPVVISR